MDLAWIWPRAVVPSSMEASGTFHNTENTLHMLPLGSIPFAPASSHHLRTIESSISNQNPPFEQLPKVWALENPCPNWQDESRLSTTLSLEASTTTMKKTPYTGPSQLSSFLLSDCKSCLSSLRAFLNLLIFLNLVLHGFAISTACRRPCILLLCLFFPLFQLPSQQ